MVTAVVPYIKATRDFVATTMPTCPVPTTSRIVLSGIVAFARHPMFTVGFATVSALSTFTTGRKLIAHGTHSRWYVAYVSALCAAQVAAFGSLWLRRP